MLDHKRDIASDLEVFYGIREWRSLPPPEYFWKAARLFGYQGMMRLHLEAEINSKQDTTQARTPAMGAKSPSTARVEVPDTREAIERNPELSALVEFG